MNLKDVVVSLFVALSKDEELLTLMEVPTRNMADLKKQIIEDKYPVDLINDSLSRICIYENSTTRTSNPLIEKGWVQIDVYVHRDVNKKDRRVLLIADKLIKNIDTANRMKQGKSPILCGVNLSYYNRIPSLFSGDENWVKYGLVFTYDYIR